VAQRTIRDTSGHFRLSSIFAGIFGRDVSSIARYPESAATVAVIKEGYLSSQLQFNLVLERKIWTVSELTGRIRDLLTAAFGAVSVEGEISNFRDAQSGHLYFTLKDDKAQVKCVCFRTAAMRLKFRPEDGLKVRVRGSVSVYEARGEYQIYVDNIEPVGLGALQLAFEQLKKKLAAEGLFDVERKKPLPMLPLRIGVITSPRASVLRDILRILRRRFPNVRVMIYPVRVQGDGAAEEIVQALAYFNSRAAANVRADVVILARGGGSLEDLWAFNEEKVARAIFASGIPIVSAIGHETDFTIADFVADVRASTPSHAAEIVLQTREAFDHHIIQLRESLCDRIRFLIMQRKEQLHDLVRDQAFRRAEDLVREYRQRADELALRLGDALREKLDLLRERFTEARARVAAYDLRVRLAALRLRSAHSASNLQMRVDRFLVAKRQRYERLVLQLEERSPLRVLDRGYSIIYDAAGNVVRSAEQVRAGNEISVRLARGKLIADVKRTEPA
jgi:exodeoxyribonuclease VII large subunit